jgi:thiamine pyrophosphate-dependent acetolactate synthase large subunit-like protein
MKNNDYKINNEIKKSLKEAKKQLNSNKFRKSLKDAQQIDIEKMKKELEKAKLEIEKNREQLKKELQKMKDENNAVMLDQIIGLETPGPIII